MLKKTVQFYEIDTLFNSLRVVSKLSEDAAEYIKEHFLERIGDNVTWGDAEMTLARGSLVRTLMREIAEEYQTQFDEPCALILPNDLEKTLVAFDG